MIPSVLPYPTLITMHVLQKQRLTFGPDGPSSPAGPSSPSLPYGIIRCINTRD